MSSTASIVPCSSSANGSSGYGAGSDMSSAGATVSGGNCKPRCQGVLQLRSKGVSSLSRADYAWSTAWSNLRGGLEITAQQPDLYVKLVLLYSLPPLASAWLLQIGRASCRER